MAFCPTWFPLPSAPDLILMHDSFAVGRPLLVDPTWVCSAHKWWPLVGAVASVGELYLNERAKKNRRCLQLSRLLPVLDTLWNSATCQGVPKVKCHKY